MIRMTGKKSRIAEHQYQHRPGDEATDMRPERDAATLDAERRESAQQLQEQPVPEHEYRGHGNCRYVEAEEDLEGVGTGK